MAILIEAPYKDVFDDYMQYHDITSRAKLMHALNPIIQQSVIAAGGDPSNPVTMAKAKMMVLAGLKSYDPEKSTMKNFLYSHLRGLNRALGTANNIIQTPETVVLDKNKIARAEQELFDKLGRFPNTDEVADYTGLSVKRITKLRKADVPISEGQVQAVLGENGAPNAHRLGDTTVDDSWMEYVYDAIDDRQKSIMENLYGMHGNAPISAQEVAKKLKITPAAVSQQRKKIDTLINSEDKKVIFGE